MNWRSFRRLIIALFRMGMDKKKSSFCEVLLTLKNMLVYVPYI